MDEFKEWIEENNETWIDLSIDEAVPKALESCWQAATESMQAKIDEQDSEIDLLHIKLTDTDSIVLEKDKKIDEKDRELNGLKEDINCLAGAIWRLRKYGYLVESEQGMESEEAQQEHWLSILDFYVEKARSIFKPETSTTQPPQPEQTGQAPTE
jgi:hypothetical protein